MSASDKKKLRKEQNAQILTDRQKKEQKEAKKLKVYTGTFIVLMVLVVAIVLGVTLKTPVTGLIRNNTKAMTVGDHKISATELNYFYIDSVSDFVNQFSDYGEYASIYLQMYAGLNPAVALDQQVYNQQTGETWADLFITNARENAKWTYVMYDKAMAEGFKLTETEQKNLDNLETTLEMYAAYQGYSNVNAYLRGTYGDSASIKTFAAYTKVSTIARAYTTQYYSNLKFTEQDYRDYESKEDRYKTYNSYSFSTYYLAVSDYQTFLGGGTEVKGEDGKTTVTYTDEQKEAARKAAEEAAKSLASDVNNTLEKLNLAISKLDINEKKKDVKATESKHTLYSAISNEDVKKWVTDDARKQGDLTTIEVKSGTGDNATVSGYYVVLFDNCNENKQPLANVQHILVKFEGGKKDSVTGKMTYTDEEKKKAQDKAQAILDEFLKGEKKDSAAFGELAKTKSEDTGSKSTGGLIADIYRDAGYVEAFTDWALAGHKPGDTGLVETEYGWHVMFYKEDGDTTYRDKMINKALADETYDKWTEDALNAVTSTVHTDKGLDRGLIISKPQ